MRPLARLWSRPTCLLIAAAWRAAAAGAAETPITLRLAEPVGVPRHAEAVTAGLPFPRGTLSDGGRVVVTDAAGRPVAIQTATLERWPDGTVRWLLLDFLADAAGDREAAYRVRAPGRPVWPAGIPRLAIARGAEGIRIDTGALRLTVPATGAALASHLTVAGRSTGATIPLPARAGAGPPVPDAPRIETAGPVRGEVLLTGRWADGLAYEARVAAFAGARALRLRYTLVHAGAEEVIALRGLGVRVVQGLREGAFGLGGEARGLAPLLGPHALRLRDARDATLDAAPVEARPDCWTAGRGATTTLLVSPQCWQQYPQTLTLSPDGLGVDLFAGGDEPVRLGRGAAKTHEVWVAFDAPGGLATAPQLAAALAAPLAAHVDPRWVVRTGALSGALHPGAAGAAAFLDLLREAVRRYRARADAERWSDGPPGACDTGSDQYMRTGFYGALNWGDWNFPGYRDRSKGCDAWGNLEYDLPQVLGLGWIATGGRPMWDTFVAAALHYRDVDLIHHDPAHPDRVGLNHPHKVDHFSPEARQNVDLGHTWVEGLITHYRLTGEARSRAAALAMGDALAARLGKAGNPRQFGWPMIALAALSDATGEPRYRAAAARFAAPALTAFEPTPAAADWKIGILADGLAAVQAVAPDPARLAWLVAYADALLAAPPERFPDARYALPLGVLASWRDDERARARALAVASALRIGDWGKALALWGRTGFRLLAPLAAPVRPGPADPPPASGRAPSPR